MLRYFGFWILDFGLGERSLARAQAPLAQSKIQNPESKIAPRRGLTLVELLITIVILVTLLAGVLPLVSPNNDNRKIREASRQLVSLFAQAQAQAARDGRPVGVGFRAAWTDTNSNNVIDPGEMNGMAQEAFIIAEPPPFTGFASQSCVIINGGDGDAYSDLTATAPVFGPQYPPLVNITFGRGIGGENVDVGQERLPPQMFRGGRLSIDPDEGELEVEEPGDLIEVGNEVFEILSLDCDSLATVGDDDDSDPDVEPPINGVVYLEPQYTVTARWLTWRYRDTSLAPRGGKAYRIRRRPTTNLSPSRTTAEAIQFPRGIGIDMDPTDGNVSLGVVFAPNGTVDAVYRDGQKQDPEPLFIMLGRVENGTQITGTPSAPFIDYSRYQLTGDETDDDLAELRTQINLLNPDSRWVVVTPAGRVLGAENYLIDPRRRHYVDGPSGDDSPRSQHDRQREGGSDGSTFLPGAQYFAANYDAETGG